MNVEIYRKLKDRKVPLVNLGLAAAETALSALAYSRGDVRSGTDWANVAIINVGAALISTNANGDWINYANFATNVFGGIAMGGAYKLFSIQIYLATPITTVAQTALNVFEICYKRENKL